MDINQQLLVALKAAALRIRLANREGQPILSAWLPDAEAAIAAAEAVPVPAQEAPQPIAWQWRLRDRVMVHESVWSFVDYHTGLKIKAHADKYETRPLYLASQAAPVPAQEAPVPVQKTAEQDRAESLKIAFDVLTSYLTDHCPDDQPWETFDAGVDEARACIAEAIEGG